MQCDHGLSICIHFLHCQSHDYLFQLRLAILFSLKASLCSKLLDIQISRFSQIQIGTLGISIKYLEPSLAKLTSLLLEDQSFQILDFSDLPLD